MAPAVIDFFVSRKSSRALLRVSWVKGTQPYVDADWRMFCLQTQSSPDVLKTSDTTPVASASRSPAAAPVTPPRFGFSKLSRTPPTSPSPARPSPKATPKSHGTLRRTVSRMSLFTSLSSFSASGSPKLDKPLPSSPSVTFDPERDLPSGSPLARDYARIKKLQRSAATVIGGDWDGTGYCYRPVRYAECYAICDMIDRTSHQTRSFPAPYHKDPSAYWSALNKNRSEITAEHSRIHRERLRMQRAEAAFARQNRRARGESNYSFVSPLPIYTSPRGFETIQDEETEADRIRAGFYRREAEESLSRSPVMGDDSHLYDLTRAGLPGLCIHVPEESDSQAVTSNRRLRVMNPSEQDEVEEDEEEELLPATPTRNLGLPQGSSESQPLQSQILEGAISVGDSSFTSELSSESSVTGLLGDFPSPSTESDRYTQVHLQAFQSFSESDGLGPWGTRDYLDHEEVDTAATLDQELLQMTRDALSQYRFPAPATSTPTARSLRSSIVSCEGLQFHLANPSQPMSYPRKDSGYDEADMDLSDDESDTATIKQSMTQPTIPILVEETNELHESNVGVGRSVLAASAPASSTAGMRRSASLRFVTLTNDDAFSLLLRPKRSRSMRFFRSTRSDLSHTPASLGFLFDPHTGTVLDDDDFEDRLARDFPFYLEDTYEELLNLYM